MARYRRITTSQIALVLFLLGAGAVFMPQVAAYHQTALTGSQAWVTILCRFADSRPAPYPVSHYEELMESVEPYWREVSYGNIPDLAGSVVVGWYDLPHPRPYYIYDEDGDGDIDGDDFLRSNYHPNAGVGQRKLAEDCTAAAEADVFFPDFWGINVIVNQQLPGLPGYPIDKWDRTEFTLDGRRQLYGGTILAVTANPGLIEHEMGHQYGMPHSFGPYGQTYDSLWDIMSGSGGFAFDEHGAHPIAYFKDLVGWIPAHRKYVAPPNSTHTLMLERLALPGPEGYLMAEIPIGDSGRFYTVEARRFAGYDEVIPGEAVVIHEVHIFNDPRQTYYIGNGPVVVDIDNNGNVNDAGAMWTPGEVFTDAENGIQISVDAAYATGYHVTINTPPAPFPPQATLENPSLGSFQSGIGALSGWACAAEEVVIEMNGTPVQAAYGTAREDTRSVCGDANNGFSLLFNWNLLGEGEHTVRALVDGVEFANTTVRVTTFGEEFLRGVSGTFTLADFPAPDETAVVMWDEAQQNFVITDGSPAPGGGYNQVAGLSATLENPSLGSFQSGIGALSGWACAAEEVVIEMNGTPVQAAYGTAREDTRSVCGDANNGFSLLFNWNLLGEGEHTVRALVDGVEFANTTVRVTTFGEEFLRGVSGTFTLADFPQSGADTTLRWEQSLQNFVIVP